MKKVFPNTAERPALVTVFFGANDAALPDRGSARQHVSVAQYASNLRAMVQTLRDQSIENIVLITPPPVDEQARVAHAKAERGSTSDLSERTNEVTGQYARACTEVAQALDLPVLDLWTRLQQVPNWTDLLDDGLHLSEGGNLVVYHELQGLISKDLPHLQADKLALDLPLHSEITDPANIEAPFRSYLT